MYGTKHYLHFTDEETAYGLFSKWKQNKNIFITLFEMSPLLACSKINRVKEHRTKMNPEVSSFVMQY